MKVRTLSAVVTAVILALLIDARAEACATMVAPGAAPKAQPCSQACLVKVMADFKASLLAKKTVELAKDAEVRENMEVTTVDKAAGKDVRLARRSTPWLTGTSRR